MFKLSGLVIDKEENIIDRLNNIYSSMHGLNLSVIFLIISDGKNADFYFGIKTNTSDFQDNIELSEAFQKVFKGNFPGSKIDTVAISQCNKILDEIMPESGQNAITSLTSLPSLKNDEAENIQYVQGIEKFIDTMQGEKYAVLIISDPVSGGQIERIKQGYEELYSELAPLSEYNLTLGTNEGVSLTESQMEGYTDTIGKSVSKTQSFTKGTSVTKSESTTNTFGVGAGAMGNLGSMNSITSNSSKNIVQTLVSSLFGGPVAEVAASSLSQAIGANLGINISRAKQIGVAIADQDSQQIGHQETEQKSKAKTTQEEICTPS